MTIADKYNNFDLKSNVIHLSYDPLQGCKTMVNKMTVEGFVGKFFASERLPQMLEMIDCLWDSSCLEYQFSFDECREISRLIAVSNQELSIHDRGKDIYRAIRYVVSQLEWNDSSRNDLDKVIITNLEFMNYPALLEAFFSCLSLLEKEEAIKPLENVMNNSSDHTVVAQCIATLHLLYEKYCPKKLLTLEFSIQEKVDKSSIIEC